MTDYLTLIKNTTTPLDQFLEQCEKKIKSWVSPWKICEQDFPPNPPEYPKQWGGGGGAKNLIKSP